MSSLLGYVAVYNLRLATIRKAYSVHLSDYHTLISLCASPDRITCSLRFFLYHFVSMFHLRRPARQLLSSLPMQELSVITSFTQSPSSWLLVTLLCDGSTSFKKSSAIVDCWLSALRLMITYVSIACCVPPKRIYKGFVELNQVKNK